MFPDTHSTKFLFADPEALLRQVDLLVQDDPSEALTAFDRALLDRDLSTSAQAILGWGLGRAQFELGRLDLAANTLRTARALADRSTRDLVGRIRISLALVLSEGGHARAALGELERAAPALDAGGLARLHLQRSLVLFHAGQFVAALADADEAIARTTALGDDLGLLRATVNRSIICLRQSDLPAALADCDRASAMAEALHQPLVLVGIAHNRALIHARNGNILSALAAFDLASAQLSELGSSTRIAANLERDRAETLLLAGMAREAAVAAERAEDLALRSGNMVAAGEAALLAALAFEHLTAVEEAKLCAKRATAAFRHAGRPGWAAYAGLVSLRVLLVEAGPSQLSHWRRSARRLRSDLRENGWMAESEQVAVVLARLELRAGNSDRARLLLATVAPSAPGTTVADRVHTWLARAQLHAATGDVVKARRAVHAGMRLVERHAAVLGADLQVAAATLGHDLASLGTSIAVRRRNPKEVLYWADRWRAWTLPRYEATLGPRVGEAVAEFRQLTVELRTSERGSRSERDLRRRVQRAQEEVAERGEVAGARSDVRSTPLDVLLLAKALDDTTLREYVLDDGDLWVVTMYGTRQTKLDPLGAVDVISDEIDHLLGAMRRTHRQGRAADLDPTSHQAERLDEMLMRYHGTAPTGPVVLVPVGPLHQLPWSMLPSLRDRAVTVAPSAAHWLAGRSAAAHDSVPMGTHTRGSASRHAHHSLALIAGPDLPGAVIETRMLADAFADTTTTVLTGAAATPQGVLRAASSARVLHIAAHGEFRTDNPWLSSILLHEGRITVHDLANLQSVPEVVVLSACDIGRAAHLGDELIGFSHALLAIGVRTVIAALLPVPDEAVAPVMLRLHERIRSGLDPAAALATIRGTTISQSVAARSFICIGTV